jgi:hypothetical protein
MRKFLAAAVLSIGVLAFAGACNDDDDNDITDPFNDDDTPTIETPVDGVGTPVGTPADGTNGLDDDGF